MWAWARSREEGCPFSRHARAGGTLLAGRCADDEGALPVERAADARRGTCGGLGAAPGAPGTRWVAALGWRGVGAGATPGALPGLPH